MVAIALPASAGNLSDITGPNVSDITGPNVSDITGPNTSDITGTNTTAAGSSYTRASASQLADDIGETYAACGDGDCPELYRLLEYAAAILDDDAVAEE